MFLSSFLVHAYSLNLSWEVIVFDYMMVGMHLCLKYIDILKLLYLLFQLTSEEVVKSFIARIKEINPILNCMVDERFEEALKDAKAIDKLIEYEIWCYLFIYVIDVMP